MYIQKQSGGFLFHARFSGRRKDRAQWKGAQLSHTHPSGRDLHPKTQFPTLGDMNHDERRI